MRAALPCAVLMVAAAACSRPEGMWRDQYVFVADDGTVVPLGVLRWADGHAEAKGWLGEDGRWRSNFYRRYPISRASGPDPTRALSILSGAPGAPARIHLSQEGDEAELRLRTPTELMVLRAEDLAQLGQTVDPEGTSVYRGGRARLRNGGTAKDGWLLVEETPPESPRNAFVGYGDFAFVVVAHPERGLVVAKHSAGQSGFDHAFVHADAARASSTDVRLGVEARSIELALPELRVSTRLEIRDRQRTAGVDPDGAAVAYETLLLGGDYAGVAFTIRPASHDRAALAQESPR